jgi:hypothetical protein
LQPWVHRYNHHRAHTALGSRPPISRVNNLPSYNTKVSSSTDSLVLGAAIFGNAMRA